MQEFSYLKSNYYSVDSRTTLLQSDIKPKEALNLDLSIEKTVKEPKVLIFHTHSHEGFADSDMSKGLQEGIWGAGERLKEILETEYGIGVQVLKSLQQLERYKQYHPCPQHHLY